MAGETSGGRIGKTIYLDTDTINRLSAVAKNLDSHPATRQNRFQTREGSVSAVIETIIRDYDRIHKELEAVKTKLAEQDKELYRLPQVRREAARAKTDFEALAKRISLQLDALATGNIVTNE